MPKVESGEALRAIATAWPTLPLLPLIESARSVAYLDEIAAAPNVQRLVFGTIDFQAGMDIEGDSEELLLYRSQFVLASRLANLQAPVDGVSTSIDDAGRVEADAPHACRLGFGGKLCVHPRPVAAVNRSFSLTRALLNGARRVFEADAASGDAPAVVEGKMMDRPVVLKACSLLHAGKQR